MRRTAASSLIALLLSSCLLGCGGTSTGGSDSVEGRAAAVVLKLDALVRAGRYDQVCDELLTFRARLRAGGQDCAREMRVRTAGLVGSSISLIGVRAAGPDVRARVRVSSKTGAMVERTVVLARLGRLLRVDGITR